MFVYAFPEKVLNLRGMNLPFCSTSFLSHDSNGGFSQLQLYKINVHGLHQLHLVRRIRVKPYSNPQGELVPCLNQIFILRTKTNHMSMCDSTDVRLPVIQGKLNQLFIINLSVIKSRRSSCSRYTNRATWRAER